MEGSITVQLVASLACLDSVVSVLYTNNDIFFFGQIQSSLTGEKPYIGQSPYSEISLIRKYRLA